MTIRVIRQVSTPFRKCGVNNLKYSNYCALVFNIRTVVCILTGCHWTLPKKCSVGSTTYNHLTNTLTQIEFTLTNVIMYILVSLILNNYCAHVFNIRTALCTEKLYIQLDRMSLGTTQKMQCWQPM